MTPKVGPLVLFRIIVTTDMRAFFYIVNLKHFVDFYKYHQKLVSMIFIYSVLISK